MSRARTIIFMSLVFFATMGVYFYVKLKDVYGQKIEQEYGNPETDGFREVFLADAILTDRREKEARGNSDRAAAVADLMREDTEREAGKYVELPAENDMLKIERPRVYCLIRDKYCFFLIYVPTLMELSDEVQQDLATDLWSHAQTYAAAEIQGYPTIGVGLRGHRLYGPILIGGKRGEPLLTQKGGRYVFYPYFEGESALQPPASAEGEKTDSVARQTQAK